MEEAPSSLSGLAEIVRTCDAYNPETWDGCMVWRVHRQLSSVRAYAHSEGSPLAPMAPSNTIALWVAALLCLC